MKQKTHKGTAKRTKITGTGKVLFRKAAGNHLMSSKNPRQLALAGGSVRAPKGHMKQIARLLKVSKKVSVRSKSSDV
ncbi:MAG TPA: bL35 family ribosomal protein [Candidatus Gracilibacteria bacterium]